MYKKITQENFNKDQEINITLRAKYVKIMTEDKYDKIYHLFIVMKESLSKIDIFGDEIKKPFFTYNETTFFKVKDGYMKNNMFNIGYDTFF